MYESDEFLVQEYTSFLHRNRLIRVVLLWPSMRVRKYLKPFILKTRGGSQTSKCIKSKTLSEFDELIEHLSCLCFFFMQKVHEKSLISPFKLCIRSANILSRMFNYIGKDLSRTPSVKHRTSICWLSSWKSTKYAKLITGIGCIMRKLVRTVLNVSFNPSKKWINLCLSCCYNFQWYDTPST